MVACSGEVDGGEDSARAYGVDVEGWEASAAEVGSLDPLALEGNVWCEGVDGPCDNRLAVVMTCACVAGAELGGGGVGVGYMNVDGGGSTTAKPTTPWSSTT